MPWVWTPGPALVEEARGLDPDHEDTLAGLGEVC